MLARTIKTSIVAALLALSVVPVAAFASPESNGKGDASQVREDKKEGKEKHKESFPMPAAEFKAKVEARAAKFRERIIERMNAKSVPADKQKVVLAKFDERSAKVMVEVDKVCADGTVTKEEARAVHKLARELREEARAERGAHRKHDGKGKNAQRRDR
jgi:hypothetical protein